MTGFDTKDSLLNPYPRRKNMKPDSQNKAPLSVIIPCYQCKETIGRALASVASQTWPPQEVILVDDGNNEEIASFLEEMQELYGKNWIKLFRLQENQGPGAARNLGWDASTQPYIAFLDADDTWHPKKVELQLSFMLSHPEVALTAHRWTWLEKWSGDNVPDNPSKVKAHPISPRKLLLSNRLATPTVMLRRNLPFRFDPRKRFSEDYLLFLTILLSGFPGFYLEATLTYLHKPPYGASGLSGKLWAMEVGELDTYLRLYREGRIPLWILMGIVPFSLAKYARRVVRSLAWRRKV